MVSPHRNKRSKTTSTGAASAAITHSIVDLPLETQKEIVKHVQRRDLTTLQQVSRHFHPLASARLYQMLNFILTRTDAPISKSFTRLADALHTFATSEHDYGQYVKFFTLELSERDSDEIQKKVLSKYHFEEESTKLLNTALLLMLRKTVTLESFGWDTAIELSGYVYDALSRINTLQDLRVRLDTSAVPRMSSFPFHSGPPNHPGMPHPPPPQNPLGQTNPQHFFTTSSASSASVPIMARASKVNARLNAFGARRFSTFKDLRRLKILGIDDLNCIPEIAKCMSACSATLKALTLTLSGDLARRARKPLTPNPPTNHATDPLEDEDDDDMTPPPEPPAAANAVPINEADIKKEKVLQESILAKVFCLEPAERDDRKVDKILKASALSAKSNADIDQVFQDEMRKIIVRLLEISKSHGSPKLNEKKILQSLEKLIEKYAQCKGAKPKKPTSASLFSPKSSQHPPNPHHMPNQTSLVQKNAAKGMKYPNQQLQDLIDLEHTATGDLENLFIVNSGGVPVYPTSVPSVSYNSDGTFNGLPSTFMPLASLHASGSTYVSHAGPAVGSSSSNHHHFPPSSSNAGYPVAGSNLSKSISAIQQELYEKALADLDDQNIKALISNAGHRSARNQADIETESDTSEAEQNANFAGPVILDGAVLFPVAEPGAHDQEDDMDVDMEHPDVIETDAEDIQESIEDSNFTVEADSSVADQEDPGPMKNSVAKSSDDVQGESLPSLERVSPLQNAMAKTASKRTGRAKSADETMQEYIRTKHGFHIEEFSLYLVPLKASVVGRALDISYLQRIALLGVGPQGGFWSLVDKVRKESIPIQLQSIHTDDVSAAFLNCISNFSGLRELFLMRRNSKSDGDSTVTKNPATLTDIRILALRKHISTLKCLSIISNDDESWDLDTKCMRLLVAKGAGLLELAFNVNINDYHVLMQGLPGLKNLIAFNIAAIRTSDACVGVNRECRKFTIDNINHCPGLKIRYLAISNVVYELARKSHYGPALRRLAKASAADSKGKGKAKADERSSSRELSADSEDFSEIESGGLEMACIKHLKFTDVPGVKIFQLDIRTGKL